MWSDEIELRALNLDTILVSMFDTIGTAYEITLREWESPLPFWSFQFLTSIYNHGLSVWSDNSKQTQPEQTKEIAGTIIHPVFNRVQWQIWLAKCKTGLQNSRLHLSNLSNGWLTTSSSSPSPQTQEEEKGCALSFSVYSQLVKGTRPTAAHRYQFHKFRFWGTFNIQLKLNPGAKGTVVCDLGTIIKLTRQFNSFINANKNNTESTKEFALQHPTQQLWKQENTQTQLLNPFVTTSTSCTKIPPWSQTTNYEGKGDLIRLLILNGHLCWVVWA